jgi:hypothetical protein
VEKDLNSREGYVNSSFDGEYVDGSFVRGVYKNADGSSYEGEWLNGKFEGKGRLKDASGRE